jgi:hypothetical protein
MGLGMRLIVNKGKCNQRALKYRIYYFINVNHRVFRQTKIMAIKFLILHF